MINCEEGWGQRGLVSSQRRILDRFRRLVVAEEGGWGSLEGCSSTRCCKNVVYGGSSGGGGGLKRFPAIFGWGILGLMMMMMGL